ncbi:recombinase family protein [Thiorhodococcus fuscus]|uniref:Recombinase family protein n=1 Tax=Thiorhodococcus fuscus TaxID=527200 RepID=A0ABW4Y6A8_9GAMM
MSGQQVGYIRVSSVDQNSDRQLVDVELDKTFTEKASGKNTAGRPILAQCLAYVREGDTIHVHSIDRLARNLAELQSLVDDLVSCGVSVQFHKENLTFQAGAGDPMQRLMLQMMGAFAEFERSMIRERQREGIAEAKRQGKQIGRARKLDDDQIAAVRERIAKGENKKAIAADLGISRQTLYSALG